MQTQTVSSRVEIPTPPPLKRQPGRRPTKSEREAAKTVVLAAIAQGHAIAKAAKMAGVSPEAASRWIRAAKSTGDDLSRERLLNQLSQTLSSPSTPIQYVTPMASLYADLQGYKDRKDKRVELKPVGALFNSWRAEIESSETLAAVSVPIEPNK